MGKGSSGSWSSTDCKVSTSGGYRDKNYVRLFCTSIVKNLFLTMEINFLIIFIF